VTIRTLRYSLTAAVLATVVGCGGEPPTQPGTTPPRVVSIAITSPTEITGPGVVRAFVDIRDTSGHFLDDTISTTVTTTGPLTASWETGYHNNWFRVLSITASGPGTGSVTVSAGGKTGSIAITADALSFQSITAADGYACGIALDQRAWCWGGNDDEELGMMTTEDCNGSACQYGGNRGNPTPLLVAGNASFTQIVTSAISCESTLYLQRAYTCGRTCALTAAGAAICWGDGYGFPTQTGTGLIISALSVVVTRNVYGVGMRGLTCGLTIQGAGYCFTPAGATPIGNGMTFTSLSVGTYHSCGVGVDGNVYCWGSNTVGALGIGSADSLSHPNPERAVASVKFTSVVVGDYSTCALDTSGTVQCWGQGYAVAGTSPPAACPGTTTLCQTTPRPIEGGGTYTAFSLAQNYSLLCGLTSGGTVSCWTTFNGAPSAVSLPEALTNISVGGPRVSGCGVAASHVAYCWGSSLQGSKVGQ
jgi:hypothetical protein